LCDILRRYCGVSDGCGYVIAQQIVGSIVCIAWAVANSGLLIAILGRMHLMRVDLADEISGLDNVNHGGSVNMSSAPVADTSLMPRQKLLLASWAQNYLARESPHPL
jgi:hypothetical protein